MRNLFLATTLLALSVASGADPGKAGVTGEYVEARTASVFAGACHYNGELTTDGREAEMVWHITGGSYRGTPLSGLTVIASVTGDANLKYESTTRRTLFYVDDRASGAQTKALVGLLVDRCGPAFGRIGEVKNLPITYRRDGETYRVEAGKVTTLAVDAMPNHECCKQPNLIWYKPLADITDRRVGYTRVSGIQDKEQGVLWTRNGQNTAMYGTFSL